MPIFPSLEDFRRDVLPDWSGIKDRAAPHLQQGQIILQMIAALMLIEATFMHGDLTAVCVDLDPFRISLDPDDPSCIRTGDRIAVRAETGCRECIYADTGTFGCLKRIFWQWPERVFLQLIHDTDCIRFVFDPVCLVFLAACEKKLIQFPDRIHSWNGDEDVPSCPAHKTFHKSLLMAFCRITEQRFKAIVSGERGIAFLLLCMGTKDILLRTANTVFDFGFFSNSTLGYDEQCNSFCALIYYVHVLGDHIADIKSVENKNDEEPYTINDLKISVGGRNDGSSIIAELLTHFEILFKDQKSIYKYTSMVSEIRRVDSKLRTLNQQSGGINTVGKYREYNAYAQELMDILKRYIPLLLKEEPFFREVFYPQLK